MNGEYIIYDTQTGLIRRLVSCPVKDINLQIQTGEDFLYGKVDDAIHYVDVVHKVAKLRPNMPVLIVGQELIGVPKGALIYIEDKVYDADGTKIDLDFHYVGTYHIRVEFFPFLDWETSIEVNS